MSDSTPLFGEESGGEKFLTWAVIIVLVVWSLFCFAIGIAFGVISNPANFLLAGCVVLGSVAAILMFRWWRAEDLDPKFRILLLLLIANVVLVGVAVNVNVWSNHCPQSWADKCVDFNPKTVLPPYPRQVASSLFYNMCLPMCNQGQGYDFNVPPGSTPICRFFNGTGNRR